MVCGLAWKCLAMDHVVSVRRIGPVHIPDAPRENEHAPRLRRQQCQQRAWLAAAVGSALPPPLTGPLEGSQTPHRPPPASSGKHGSSPAAGAATAPKQPV